MDKPVEIRPKPVRKKASNPPFSMTWIIISTIIFLPITGGIMTAVNWSRLGQPGNRIKALLLAAVGSIISGVIPAIALMAQSPSEIAIIGFGILISNIVFAVIYSLWQRPAYQQWVAANDGKHPSLRRSGCLSYFQIVMGTVILATIFKSPIQQIVLSLTAQFKSAQTLTVNGLTLTKPRGWFRIDTNTVNHELCNMGQCLVIMQPIEADLTLFIIRIKGTSNLLTGGDYRDISAQEFTNMFWDALKTQLDSVNELIANTPPVNGHDAFRRVADFSVDRRSRRFMMEIIKESDQSVLLLYAEGEQTNFNDHLARVNDIIQSMQFSAVQP